MTMRTFPLILFLLFGTPYVDHAFGQSVPFQDGLTINNDLLSSNPDFFRFDGGVNSLFTGSSEPGYRNGVVSDPSVASFSDLLYNQLMTSDAFRIIFSSSLDASFITNLCQVLAQCLIDELGLADSGFLANALANALISISPGASFDVYGRSFANALGEALWSSNVLNANASVDLANSASRTILKAMSFFLNGYADGQNSYNPGLGVQFSTALPIDVNKRNALSFIPGVNVDTRVNAGETLQSTSGYNFDASNLLNTNTDSPSALFNSQFGLNSEFDGGLDNNAGLDIINQLGFGTDGVGSGQSAVTDQSASNLGFITKLGSDSFLNPDVNTNTAAITNLGVRGNLDTISGLGVKNALDIPTNAAVDGGLATDVYVSPNDVDLFKTELKKGLLNDRTFLYVFSDYVPVSVLKLIASAITQNLSKAFPIPRTYFFLLENNIRNLPSDKVPLASSCSEILASTLANVFSKLKLMTPSTMRLQAIMATNAIKSAIQNFLEISAIPGLGLSTNGNSYNSYFSPLNGLEKLPYVGSEAVSRKLPPIIKTAKASAVRERFVKVLFYNLVSYYKFSEISLNAPTSSYKYIAYSMGKYMAEAFGSPYPSFFSNNYIAALLSTGKMLNSRDYAKVLSLATGRSLYQLGYFLSGDVNIQAAIAANAIIRAITAVFQPASIQVVMIPGLSGLPLTTQLKGVAPSNSLLNVGTDSNIGVGLGANLGSGVGLGDNLGTGAGLGAKLGTGVELGADLEADVGIGTDFKAGDGLRADFGADVGFGNRMGMDVGQGNRLGANFGTDVGLDNGMEWQVGQRTMLGNGIGTNVNVNANVDAGIGAGLGMQNNYNDGINRRKRREIRRSSNYNNLNFNDLGSIYKGLDLGANGGIDFGNNAGLGSKNNIIIDAGGRSGLDIGNVARLSSGTISGLSPGANVRFGLRDNAGLGLGGIAGSGLGENAGLGLILNAPNSAQTQLSITDVLPQILASKLYKSTALYTSVNIVGIRKVLNLIGQGIAVEFGFSTAAVFLDSLDKNLAYDGNNEFEQNVNALALALTEALAEAGVLNLTFSVKTADDLATATVAKISSLIATSLVAGREIKWTYLQDEDRIPSLYSNAVYSNRRIAF